MKDINPDTATTDEPATVTDTYVGWTIDAAFADGTYRLRSPIGEVRRVSFYRSIAEAQIAAACEGMQLSLTPRVTEAPRRADARGRGCVERGD